MEGKDEMSSMDFNSAVIVWLFFNLKYTDASHGGRQGSPLQRSCLENPMDRGAWWVTVQRVAKSQTQLSTSILNIVLCYVVSPCCLSALHIVVCICQSQTPHLSPIPLPLW